jgi:hypothetical protein
MTRILGNEERWMMPRMVNWLPPHQMMMKYQHDAANLDGIENEHAAQYLMIVTHVILLHSTIANLNKCFELLRQ